MVKDKEAAPICRAVDWSSVMEIDMENVTEARKMFDRDCCFEERGVFTEKFMKQAVKELDESAREYGKSLDEIDISGEMMIDIARDEIAIESARKLSAALDFAVENANTFVAALRDGKWVPTENRSSRRKKGVGGKRWM